jgi:hypothetical protein
VPAADELQAKLQECFLLVFPELSPQTVSQANTDTVPRWDSVAQITLLSLIGEKFNVPVDFEYFEGATSFAAIKGKMQSLLENA